MSRPFRVFLVALGGLIGLFVVASILLYLLVDGNAYKARLEAVVSTALGMEARVAGDVTISLLPGLRITLNDVHLKSRGAEIITAKKARLTVALRSLLEDRVRVQTVWLDSPNISLLRETDGRLNVATPEAKGGTLPALHLGKASLSSATLSYLDKRSGDGFTFSGCRMQVLDLRIAAGKRVDLLKQLAFEANLACGSFRKADLTVSDVNASVAAENGVYDVRPVTMDLFGARGSARVHGDFSGEEPRFDVRFSLPGFRSAAFFETLTPQKIGEGRMDFSAKLSMQGRSMKELKNTLRGELSLRGKDLQLRGIDIDREFAGFESSQNFNIVDLGAVFFAGPLGLVLTKGYNFASLFLASGGHSDIRVLFSDWIVEGGVAQARDVALATVENRIALQGGLDFANERFDDVVVALVDPNGCALLRQRIRGSFRRPVVEKPNVLESLAGPAVNLLRRAREIFPGGACEIFYAGALPAPDPPRGHSGAKDGSNGSGATQDDDDPGTGQADTTQTPEELAGGGELFDEDEAGNDRHPEQIHDPGDKQQQHQGPAAAKADETMLQAHAESAHGARTPPEHEKLQGGPAMPQTGGLGRQPLIDAGGDQQAAAHEPVSRCQARREQRGSGKPRLQCSRGQAEGGPYGQVAAGEQPR